MKVFLDANILVSVLNKEYPLFTRSARILSLSRYKSFSLFTSPLCLAIGFYFAEKKSGSVKAKRKIDTLSRNLKITEVGRKEVLQALENPAVIDFEDGLQYYAARTAGCTTIITEDTNDFYFSDIEVMNTRHFFEKYLYQ